MLRLPKFITRTLSVRLSLMFVSVMAILLVASLIFMLHFSRKAIREEALQNASQTLEGTVERIDNILLSVEQAAGNIFYSMMPHVDQPDKMILYCSRLLESNPFINGCAIAFKPGYYQDRDSFMVYIHRSANGKDSIASSLIIENTYNGGVYTEQAWYTIPLESGKPNWLNTKDVTHSGKEPVTTFCLPIYGYDVQPIGVLAVDMSLNLLSHSVLEMKLPSNTYCTVLDKEGSFIVHPDSSKLHHETISTEANQDLVLNQTVSDAAKSMVAGETGYKKFRMNNTDYYIFYRPFQRSAIPGRSLENLSWSVGIIYPENDIFGDYNRLIYYVLAIAITGLLLMFVLICIIIHRQLLPLRMLTKSAQHIAEGNYGEVIPDSQQHDEIGRLQNHFQQMQQSLATNIGELKELSHTLEERGKELRSAYEQAQRANRLKTSFLHNMTDQMLSPANAIYKDVNDLCNPKESEEKEDTKQLADDIQRQGKTIAELLNNLLHVSEEETGKEVDHE